MFNDLRNFLDDIPRGMRKKVEDALLLKGTETEDFYLALYHCDERQLEIPPATIKIPVFGSFI
jgi:hypothetical protein